MEEKLSGRSAAEQSGTVGLWRMLRYAWACYRLQKAGYIVRYPEGWYTLTQRGAAARELFGEKSVSAKSGDLFEMANLRVHQTGIEGTIYISTAQASHAPRVKYYQDRPSRSAPYFSVLIVAQPKIVEVRGMPKNVVDARGKQVIAWVALNHSKLLDFWNNGTSWFDEEVEAFKRSLQKLETP